MSNIFEALQRSESERTGVDLRELSGAMQLLEIAERDATAKDTAAVSPDSAEQPQDIESRETAVLTQPSSSNGTSSAFPMSEAEPPPKDGGLDQFAQFPSLRILVPPQSKVVSLTEQNSLAAEKFRFLAVRLRHLQQSRRLKKLVVTSTIPQEGKSMTSANLACTLARKQNQKTLLVEGDLRRPALAQLFGLGKTPGISDWLNGECGPMGCIYHLEGPGLWMLPAGNAPRNPLELLQSGKLPALFQQLAAWFDWIVIDSPPVLPLGDTSIWMRLADGILLIARQGVTEKKQLRRGLEIIERSKLLGTLLNGSAGGAHSDYYGHYSSPTVSPLNTGGSD